MMFTLELMQNEIKGATANLYGAQQATGVTGPRPQADRTACPQIVLDTPCSGKNTGTAEICVCVSVVVCCVKISICTIKAHYGIVNVVIKA